jgi:DNA-binding Xre family transcriptional regulator
VPNIQDGGKIMSIYDVRTETRGITSNVKQIMGEKGVSIVTLSNETKLSTKIIERARTDQIKLCKLETLAIIAKGLNVKTKDLFNE